MFLAIEGAASIFDTTETFIGMDASTNAIIAI